MARISGRGVDHERRQPANAFDSRGGYSGQDYSLERETAEGQAHPSGEVDHAADRRATDAGTEDIPPENGRRAFFDPVTGEVHGSGVGAGGGSPGEDFDNDPASGDGAFP